MICDGVPDCPEAQDKSDCNQYSCSGYYVYRHSEHTGVHPDHVCDGVIHCPLYLDDDASAIRLLVLMVVCVLAPVFLVKTLVLTCWVNLHLQRL